MSRATILLPLLALGVALAHAGETVRDCGTLAAVLRERRVGVPFELTAQVNGQSVLSAPFSLQDAAGSVCIDSVAATVVRPPRWSVVRVTGRTVDEDGDVKARCETLSVASQAPPATPTPVRIRDLLRTRPNGQYVTLTASVVDAFVDEIDPRIRFLILHDGDAYLFAIYSPDSPTLRDLLGCTIRVRGVSHPENYSTRRHFGLQISIFDRDDLDILRRAENYPFSAAPLDDCTGLRPEEIAALGRRRVSGHVLAIWGGDNALLRTADGRLTLARMSSPGLPSCGSAIDVVGFPETDLYQVNLARALWRPASLPPPLAEAATNLPLRTLVRHDATTPYFNPRLHGRAIRLTGRIDGLRKDAKGCGTFLLRDGGESLTVDATALPTALSALQDGDLIAATGICVLEAEEWRPNLVFPHVKGLRLVPRRPADLTCLAHAPWWTPRRCLILIAVLLALLVGIGLWNLALRRLAESRGRQLADETLARAESDFKVGERTRLAVELHDALSQTLTGIAMEIRAAGKGLDVAPKNCRPHLVRAERTIDACRNELKNCLWDLRNNAMDEPDMGQAIRRTLAPHLGPASLAVRVPASRTRLSDNLAHATLCIVRELAVNAIRHGKASRILVAGAYDGGRLLFSVRDDGCGFDPSSAPGIDEGHFGLQGIRERIEPFGGTLEIVRLAQGGTKATVTLTPPKEESPT